MGIWTQPWVTAPGIAFAVRLCLRLFALLPCFSVGAPSLARRGGVTQPVSASFAEAAVPFVAYILCVCGRRRVQHLLEPGAPPLPL